MDYPLLNLNRDALLTILMLSLDRGWGLESGPAIALEQFELLDEMFW